MKKLKNKSEFNPDKLRTFFIFYMIILYTIDLISTYLAVNSGGGFENNPVISYFLTLGYAGYLLTMIFFFSLILCFFIISEIICHYLIKFYNKEVVYVACYTSIIACFSIIQAANIIGNIFVWAL